jgi:hypothetical protein
MKKKKKKKQEEVVMMKVGFTVMIQKQATIVAVEEPTITKSKKCAASPQFNRELAHCFFRSEGDCSP